MRVSRRRFLGLMGGGVAAGSAYVFGIEPIWIETNEKGGEPSWGAKPFPKAARSGQFVALASGFTGDTEALPIRAQARVLGATLKSGETAEYRLGTARHAYLVPATGSVEVNGLRVDARDGVAIENETALTVKALEDTEIVLVDAP